MNLNTSQPRLVHRRSMRKHSHQNSRRSMPSSRSEARQINPHNTRLLLKNGQVQQQRLQRQLRPDHAPNHARRKARSLHNQHSNHPSKPNKQTTSHSYSAENKKIGRQHLPTLPTCLQKQRRSHKSSKSAPKSEAVTSPAPP